MYYYVKTSESNGNTVIYSTAKTLKQASNKLAKQQKAWPDKYPEGLSITVCKFRFDGRMIWHGDYSFENGKLKLNRKADPLLFQLGLV